MLLEEEEKNRLALENQDNTTYYVGRDESQYMDKNKNDVSENIDDGEVGEDGEEIVLGNQQQNQQNDQQ